MPKKPKSRNWRCVTFSKGKRCPNRALIESGHNVGQPEFNFNVKLKMCVFCSRKFSFAIRGLPV